MNFLSRFGALKIAPSSNEKADVATTGSITVASKLATEAARDAVSWFEDQLSAFKIPSSLSS